MTDSSNATQAEDRPPADRPGGRPAGRGRRRREPLGPWIVLAAVLVALAGAGYGAWWLIYLRPLQQQLGIARGYYDQGDYPKASTAVDKVLEREPDQVDALLVLARVKAATGESSAALALYARVVDARPRDAAVLYDMASLEMLVGNTMGAVPHLEAALAAEPDDARYLDELVKAYVATGQAAKAAELLMERAEDSGGPAAERADLYVRAADAYLAAGSQSQAKAAAKKALGLVPKHPAATALLRRIK